MDLIAARKHRHELKRAAKRKMAHKLEMDKRGSGKSPRKAMQHSTKEACAHVRAGDYGAIKRSPFKRPGVPRDKSKSR